MKTSELTGRALDWAVAKCELKTNFKYLHVTKNCLFYHDPGDNQKYLDYSSKWSQGGPIIERECIALKALAAEPVYWRAGTFGTSIGPTPLIAAMRCYVASKLGDEVDIPKELM